METFKLHLAGFVVFLVMCLIAYGIVEILLWNSLIGGIVVFLILGFLFSHWMVQSIKKDEEKNDNQR